MSVPAPGGSTARPRRGPRRPRHRGLRVLVGLLLVLTLLLVTSGTVLVVRAQRGGGPDPAADPFRGITTDGRVQPGLFTVRETGVTTRPVVQAASQFITSLTPEQRKEAGVDATPDQPAAPQA